MKLYLFLYICSISTLLYLYLHYKTKIRFIFIFIDNIVVIFISCALMLFLSKLIESINQVVTFILVTFIIIALAFIFTMIRFWRTPLRKSNASEKAIISPADGRIIYIHKIDKQEIPFSVKKNTVIQLSELVKTDLLNNPCWLVGINMTLFDVHKNCSPITGKIILQQYFKGQFFSLKNYRYLMENERNTFVIESDFVKIGIIQIASRRVRKIDQYVNKGDDVKRGQWLGMIRFGSQVDLVIPAYYCVKVNIKDQVFAGTTIIADLHENSD